MHSATSIRYGEIQEMSAHVSSVISHTQFPSEFPQNVSVLKYAKSLNAVDPVGLSAALCPCLPQLKQANS